MRTIDTAYRDDWQREADVTIAPRWDGAHLVTAWGIVRDRQLFSPWFERRATNVIARDGALDPVNLDAAVFDLLQAGDAWRDASRQLLDYFFERSLEARVAALGIPHRALGDGPLGPALLQSHL